MLRTRRLLVHDDRQADATGLWPVELRETGRQVGAAGLRHHDDGTVELTCSIRPEDRGHGYGIEAARAVAGHALDELGHPSLSGFVAITDAAALRLVFRLGMRFARAVDDGLELHVLTCERWLEVRPGR